MASSISAAGILPWARRTASSGTSVARRFASGSISSMRGQTTKLWPPRRRSRTSACRSEASSNGADDGADRPPLRRRRRDDAQILQAEHRRLQGARDGRRRQGQDVDVAREVAQLAFMGKAEALLLVDDDEAEVLEGDALAGERVRADDDVDGAVRQARLDGPRLGRPHEPGQMPDFDAEPGEAAPERLQMLAHQHGGRRHDRDLLAGKRNGRGGAQGHLGLAEADIAADQAVHRTSRGKVGEHVSDGAQLIRRFREREARDEALVVAGRGYELRRAPRFALARQRDEPLCRLGDLRLRSWRGASARPRRRAGRGRPRRRRRSARCDRARRRAPSACRRRHRRAGSCRPPRRLRSRRSRDLAARPCRGRGG